MDSLLKVDPRWCLLSLFIFSFLMATYFVVRLTCSHTLIINHDINESNISTHTGPGLLLILIHASGNGVGVRDTIRNTWVSPQLLHKLDKEVHHLVDYRFVLGAQGVSDSLLANLTKEASKHGDMILLPDVSDEHQSLSNRTLRSFQYITQKTMDFLYVMKCDDDTFVDLLAVSKELSERTTDTGFFWGQFLGAGGIIQEGPYAEFSWSVCETYLPYALGGGYLLSMDLVKLLAKNAPFLKVYKNEDVSVGAWLAPYNIDYVSDTRFNTGAVTKGCKKPYIVIHRVNATQMYRYSEAVLKDGYICNNRNYWFVWHGYRYNWKVKPSRCCRIRRKVP